MLMKLFAVVDKQIKQHRQHFDPDHMIDFIDTFLEAERDNPDDIIFSGDNE